MEPRCRIESPWSAVARRCTVNRLRPFRCGPARAAGPGLTYSSGRGLPEATITPPHISRLHVSPRADRTANAYAGSWNPAFVGGPMSDRPGMTRVLEPSPSSRRRSTRVSRETAASNQRRFPNRTCGPSAGAPKTDHSDSGNVQGAVPHRLLPSSAAVGAERIPLEAIMWVRRGPHPSVP